MVVLLYNNHNQQSDRISSLSASLEERSLQLNQQQQTIDEYTHLVSLWQHDLDAKRAELDALRAEIEILAKRTGQQEVLISEKSEHADRLETEFANLQVKAGSLEKEIEELRSAIHNKDRSIAELAFENESSKRTHVAHYMLGYYAKDDRGVVIPMEVEIIDSGAGRISVNVSNVRYETSFQDSVRTAAVVASDYTGIAISDKDIIVTLLNDSARRITIDGPSAGAILAAMIAAGLEEKEKQLDTSILVTGAIKRDGTIDRVGGISGKADAAAAHGAEIFLVPRGQETTHAEIKVETVANIDQLMNRLIIK